MDGATASDPPPQSPAAQNAAPPPPAAGGRPAAIKISKKELEKIKVCCLPLHEMRLRPRTLFDPWQGEPSD